MFDFSFIPAITELIGIKYIGDRKIKGWIFGIITNVLWISYVFYSNTTYGLLLVCSVALVLNIRGWILWVRKK